MNSFSIRALRFLANAVWYLSLVFALLIAIAICYKIWTGEGDLTWDIHVQILQTNNLPALQPATALYKYGGVKKAEAVLNLIVERSPVLIAMTIVSLGCTGFFWFGMLYQLRKILASLKGNIPFAYENIRRLRLISLFLFLIAVMAFLISLGNMVLFRQQFPSAREIYWPEARLEFVPIVASIVVLALAEIFKQGYQLKTENESFV